MQKDAICSGHSEAAFGVLRRRCAAFECETCEMGLVNTGPRLSLRQVKLAGNLWQKRPSASFAAAL